jgi:hypothetical protein
MGVCGCGDFYGDFKFKGPGRDWYVLQIYRPCSYCETPLGVILYRMNKKDQELWRVEDIPELEIKDIGTSISILELDPIKKAAFEDAEVDLDLAIIDGMNLAEKRNKENQLKASF